MLLSGRVDAHADLDIAPTWNVFLQFCLDT